MFLCWLLEQGWAGGEQDGIYLSLTYYQHGLNDDCYFTFSYQMLKVLMVPWTQHACSQRPALLLLLKGEGGAQVHTLNA